MSGMTDAAISRVEIVTSIMTTPETHSLPANAADFGAYRGKKHEPSGSNPSARSSWPKR